MPSQRTRGGARDTLDAIDRDRNQGMVDLLRRDAGDANTLDKAREYRREAAPDQFGAFDGEQPVDASGLLKTVDDAMNDASGQEQINHGSTAGGQGHAAR